MTVPLGGHTANIGRDEQDVPGPEGAEERGQRSSLSGPGGGVGGGLGGKEMSQITAASTSSSVTSTCGCVTALARASKPQPQPVARSHSALHRQPPRGQPSTQPAPSRVLARGPHSNRAESRAWGRSGGVVTKQRD